jgi:trehalose 6-phosphate synthase/phosphatase
VWHHQYADPDFGSWQAKEMQDHLESVLANEPVTVKSGAQIVEVTPQVYMVSALILLVFVLVWM